MSKACKKDEKVKYYSPICDEVIVEAVGKIPGQSSIQCDGFLASSPLCRSFIISKSDNPFYCPQCHLEKHELEMCSLKQILFNLSSQLDGMKIQGSQQGIMPMAFGSTIVHSIRNQSHLSVISAQRPKIYPPTLPVKESISELPNHAHPFKLSGHKYDIIVYGVKVSEKGTPMHNNQK